MVCSAMRYAAGSAGRGRCGEVGESQAGACAARLQLARFLERQVGHDQAVAARRCNIIARSDAVPYASIGFV